MLEQLQQGQKLLVLRYGKQIVDDCIELHQKKIEELGYCWFGKLGTVPSKKSIDAMLDEELPMLILYARGAAYICSVSEVTYDKPKDGCPDYYKRELFDNLTFPSIYFRLTVIEKLDSNELGKFAVVSSGNSAINTLMHSMSSFLFISYGKAANVEEKPKEKSKKKKREQLSENDCLYRRDGRCGLKSCVNYQYECDRPSMCIKQKR